MSDARVERAIALGNMLMGIDFPNSELLELAEDTRKILALVPKTAQAWEDVLQMAIMRAFDIGWDSALEKPEPLSEEFMAATAAKCKLHFARCDFIDALKRAASSSWCWLNVRSRGTYAVVLLACKRCDCIKTAYPDTDKVDAAIDFIRPAFLLEHFACVAK